MRLVRVALSWLSKQKRIVDSISQGNHAQSVRAQEGDHHDLHRGPVVLSARGRDMFVSPQSDMEDVVVVPERRSSIEENDWRAVAVTNSGQWGLQSFGRLGGAYYQSPGDYRN